MVPEFGAALASAKQIAETIKTVLKVSKDIDVQTQVSELYQQIINLQGTILGAQSQYDEQAENVRQLKNELLKRDNWNAEAKRYQLQTLENGTHVYSLRPECQETDPPHWLCPNCFNKGKKSILQREISGSSYGCHDCGGKNYTDRERPDGKQPPLPPTQPIKRRSHREVW